MNIYSMINHYIQLIFRQDHNITIEIMESRDVLKETLLDTKQGDIITTGVMK